MEGRARRWFDRLRHAFRRRASSDDGTPGLTFTARTLPPETFGRPPSVVRGADPAHPPTTSPPVAVPPTPALEPAPPDPAVPVRIHQGRLDRRVAPLELSPTEALRLATEGPRGLSRRQLPPDPGPHDERGEPGTEG